MKGFAIFFLLSIWVCSVYGAYCPHRPDQHCDSFWSSGSSGGNNEGFWNLYSCAARGFPAAPGSPCYDTTILRDAMTADPTPPELDPHSPSAAYDFAEWFTQESVGNRGYWNELQREAQINKPRTSNWGQVGHIALFETGSGSPFLINHGYLPFKRSIPQSIAVRSTLPNPQAPEIVSEELASEARWSVCLTDDCSQTTAPQLFGAEPYESDFLSAHNTLPTYFNWNPCGQSSGVHIWVNGELLLTFVGVGSRSGWSDGRVVLGQCVDSECSDVRVISVGAGSRDLPPVEHQCLTGFAGVGPRIVVASDGNPSLMWRNKYSPEQVVYLHCQDASCSSYDSPKFFTLESEATGSSALWWDLVASERGIWIVSLNDNKDAYVTGLTNNTFNYTNALNGYNYDAYIQITSCTDNVCSTVGTQFPSPHSSEADTPLYEEWAFSDFGWRWSTNNRDVAFAAQTYSSGVTGDGFPMWVGQIERGPQSGIAWVVCSCRDNECAVPECHFLADVNTIMDPAISQCVALGESLTTESPHRFVHGSSRQRILNGGSDGLPVIVQQVSSFCVEILPLFAQSTLARRTISRLEESLQIVNGNVQASPIEFSYDSQKQRKVLLQSQKTTYIHCLDATCSEASVSALESPKVASVSHESGYNQVDSAFISDDQILTVYSPDATSNEQSYSWTQGCAYELFEYDSNGARYVTYNTNYERTDVLDANFRSKAGNTLSIQMPSFAFDGMGYLIIVADDGSGDRIYAIDLVTGVEVYSICIDTIMNYVSLEVDLASQFIILVQHDGDVFYFFIASWNLPDICAHTDSSLLDSIPIGCVSNQMSGGLTVIPNRVTPIYSFVGNCIENNPTPYAATLNGNWFQVGPTNANYNAFDATYDYYNRAVLLTTNDNALRFYHYDESPISNTGNNRYRFSPAGQLTPSFNKKFRPNEFCSPNFNSNFGGASASDLANGESGIPNFVLLRNYLGIAPTPRTGGIKTWLTNRWSSPNGQPCQEDSVAQLVSADDVVFLCSGLRLGDNQVWGTTPINGWTRLWEWQEIGWGLRWRWQGDIHFGTDHSYDGSQFTDIASFYELNPQ